MIEIKNISKTYRTKKGLEVTALKNVSLNFPDKGMVFVLGKSGSGKSTLLNVMGGLDNYDNGELIIKGKSSKDFSQADYDSYRNTLIGFIFQEYNILDEFTIGANIALALQLQGKKAEFDTINKILDEVDLTGYGNRKPNELSGGQKQRVAIARALIKNPDIIMADEPTGALDSNTGRQVFDTLKKLSKDKLVIIVSHDREFAEYYGDRVIEFKDGEVISDISKYNALGIVKDDCNKQSFKDTDNEEVAANAKREGYKMIRSRLPFKHSLKIGLSSLKAKPVKLVFTIILSMVAFGLFGMADSFASFDKTTSLVSSLMDNKQDYVTIARGMNRHTPSNNMTDEFINNVNKSSDIKAKGVYSGKPGAGYNPIKISDNYISGSFTGGFYYTEHMQGLMEMQSAEFNDRKFSIIGNSASSIDEIVITKYIFENFQKFGYQGFNFEGEPISIDAANIGDENNFISKKIKIDINGKSYKIVGIADTNFDAKKYEKLKENNFNPESGSDDSKLIENLRNEMYNSYHSLGFVSKGTISSFGTPTDGKFNLTDLDNSNVATFQMFKNSNQSFAAKLDVTSISNDEIMLSSSGYKQHLTNNSISFPSNYDELKEIFLTGAYDNYLEVDYEGRYRDSKGTYHDAAGTKKIIGFYNSDSNSKPVIVSDGEYNLYADKSGTYAYAVGIMPKSRADIEALVKLGNTDDENTKFYVISEATDTISLYGDMFEDLADTFIYIGIGFSLFAAMMLMNYISTSINYKKREIGILRAVGARGTDVFGIFCCESMFVAIINFILSVAATIGICFGVNAVVKNTIGMPITLLTVGIRQIGLIFGLSILTAALASLISVFKISRKRPIDAIRDK